MKPAVFFLFTFYICNYLLHVECKKNYELYFIGLENLEGESESLVDFSGLNIKQNGSNYVVDGDFTYKVDMDNSFKRAIQISMHERIISSMFDIFLYSIYKIEDVPLCTFYNTTFKSVIEPTFKGHTNFPEIPPGGLCPIPKGTYHDDNAPINTDRLPDNLGKGILKIETAFYKENDYVGGWRITAFVKPL